MSQDQQQHPAVHSGGVSLGRVKISNRILMCIIGEIQVGGSVADVVGVSDI